LYFIVNLEAIRRSPRLTRALGASGYHPRYTVGEKLDWHRLTFALHDGYSVEITPAIE